MAAMTAEQANVNIYAGIEFAGADHVPLDHWEWPNFTPQEIACKGDGKVLVDAHSMDLLQTLRDMLGEPIYLNSAYRSPEHNARVGGARRSMHLHGRAFDVDMRNHDPAHFEKMARAVGFTGFGFYPPKYGGYNFIHIDTGHAREWGQRWTPEPEADAEPEAQPEPRAGRGRDRWGRPRR